MDFTRERLAMVETQIAGRGIKDRAVLDVMRVIPRHEFIPAEHLSKSYADCPLPIGFNQTISQPYMVALMTELLELTESSVVFEIGTGSGYQTAVLAGLSRKVYSVERIKELSLRTKRIFNKLSIDNVHLFVGDGTLALPKAQEKFDAIIVTAYAAGEISHYYGCLKINGRMVIPIGGPQRQMLMLFVKKADGITKSEICPCIFVPLIASGEN